MKKQTEFINVKQAEDYKVKMERIKKKIKESHPDMPDADSFKSYLAEIADRLRKKHSEDDFDEDDPNENYLDEDDLDEDDSEYLSNWVESNEGGEYTDQEDIGFSVILDSIGEKRPGVILCVRKITGVTLSEAKSMVDTVPVVILKNVSKEEAEEAVEKLKVFGAEARVC